MAWSKLDCAALYLVETERRPDTSRRLPSLDELESHVRLDWRRSDEQKRLGKEKASPKAKR